MNVLPYRGAVNVKAAKAATKPTEEPRVQVDESSIDPQMNEDGMYRDVKPKTYQVLKTELPQSEAEEGKLTIWRYFSRITSSPGWVPV